MQSPDRRQYAPATQRNRASILQVLQKFLPQQGTILEIASGSGEHAVFWAPHFQSCLWLPTDQNEQALDSIAAWREDYPSPNLLAPIFLDVHDRHWPVEPDHPEVITELINSPVAAIVNINMIHISPWSACLALIGGADRVLPEGGILYLYGPFKQNDEHTAPTNAIFDQNLKLQNSEWGVRNLQNVASIAEGHGLTLVETIEMPANNLSVIFRKTD